MVIQSTKNDNVRKAKLISTKKGREETGYHFIEGDRLVREAVISGVQFGDAFIEEGHELWEAVLSGSGANVFTVKRHIIEHLANTETPQWVCATVKTPDTAPPAEYPGGLIVALDEVREPGNMGTIIRTADAMGAAGILLSEGCVDPFSPKSIRASMGSAYHLPIWQCDIVSEIRKLHNIGYVPVCGHLSGEEALPFIEDNVVLVIGNEGHGVSEEVASLCELYRLSMYGVAESLNASVAAGIIMYEIAKKLHS